MVAGKRVCVATKWSIKDLNRINSGFAGKNLKITGVFVNIVISKGDPIAIDGA